MEKWVVINKKADFKAIGEKFGIDQVTARILRNREINEEEDIRLFLNGTLADLFNPHLLKGADTLVGILFDKIAEGKMIRVIGDYETESCPLTY